MSSNLNISELILNTIESERLMYRAVTGLSVHKLCKYENQQTIIDSLAQGLAQYGTLTAKQRELAANIIRYQAAGLTKLVEIAAQRRLLRDNKPAPVHNESEDTPSDNLPASITHEQ